MSKSGLRLPASESRHCASHSPRAGTWWVPHRNCGWDERVPTGGSRAGGRVTWWAHCRHAPPGSLGALEPGGDSRGQWHPGGVIHRGRSYGGCLRLSDSLAWVSSGPRPQALALKVLQRAASFESPKTIAPCAQDTVQVTHLKQFPQNHIQSVLSSGESWQPLCGF